MKKTFITTICLAALALPSLADGESLVVHMADGSGEQAFALSDIGKLTFGDNGFTVNASGGAASFAYGEVKCIKFTDISTGIGAAAVGDDRLKPYYRDGFLGVDGWPQGRVARAAVYGVDGTVVVDIDHWDGTPIAVSRLGRGIYVFKVENSNIKFAKQ